MLSTKSLITDLTEVPREWVFEYYLNLQEKLTGQSIMVLSPFNPKDKKPSFSVYVSNKDNKSYMFKDFSTGVSGGVVPLVQMLFSLSTKGEAAYKIISDYNQFLLTNSEDYSLRKFKVRQKYKVCGFTKRLWTNLDQKYWMNYHIGSKLLEHHNIFPLASYKMTREDEDGIKELTIQGHHIYGYFRADGSLYKIYQPMVRENKFIKVRDYIQGTDQLTMKVPYLVICSSLKDILAFSKLGYKNAEAVAPDSENNLIPEHVIAGYKHKYKAVIVLFDNDDPGKEAAKKYQDRYQLPFVTLDMSKDLSDSVRDHGVNKVRETITPLLQQAVKQNVVAV